MVPLSSQFYIFDPRLNYPLLITAKRYWIPSSTGTGRSESEADGDELTLICTHGTGFHKEQWEPTLRHLFELSAKPTSGAQVKIKEVWSIDAPNHGDAAVLNEETLRWGYEPICTCNLNLHAML